MKIIAGSSSQDHIDEIINEFTDTYIASMIFRYGITRSIGSVPKSQAIIYRILPNLDENRFRQLLRVNWQTFDFILDLIKDDQVFNGPNSWKQIPVKVQLMIVLYRLGSYGEGASITKVASLFGVGDGGTIMKITERVFKAICRLQEKYLCWPDIDERKEIVSKTSHELPFCIGYVDGTEIRLAEKPTSDPESYFTRKRQYALKLQVVCDYNFIIRHIVVGYPGSVHDNRIYSRCNLFRNARDHFSQNEWIAADSAYKTTTTVITPYRSSSTTRTASERNAFNQNLCSYRVRVENCFAFIKERFSSLKELKINVSDVNHRFACQWIFVCCILHNIIRTINIADEKLEENSPTENGSVYNEDENDATEPEEYDRDGELKRIAIMDLMKERN